ncbi:MAG TPA: hypothetical protein VFS52_24800 [Steroidobacteraceae bacterium]|jgi:hypothetical protein|nr:hypothetical protein [Steroidobacteraceae bacterium]
MTTRIAILALAAFAASNLAFAQTPPSDTSTPSSSDQPAPREAPATGTSKSRPSSASSPHQRQVTGKEKDQMMKDCIARQKAADSSVSESDAKKTCEEERRASAPSNR